MTIDVSAIMFPPILFTFVYGVYMGFCLGLGCVCRLMTKRLRAGDTSLFDFIDDVGPENFMGLICGRMSRRKGEEE